MQVDAIGQFQFTHPGKGATSRDISLGGGVGVSIHAPWEGCDSKTRRISSCATGRFNSRTLGRVRRSRGVDRARRAGFNSRTLGRVRQDTISGQ